MLVSELKLGDRVVFESVPNGSYLSTNKIYEISDMSKREIYFRSQTGSGTFDTRRMLSMPNVSFYRATC